MPALRLTLARTMNSDLSKKVSMPSEVGSSNNRLAAESVNFNKYEGKKQLYILYRRCSLAHRAVESRANITFGRGFKIITNNKREQNILNKFLTDLHPTDPVTALLVKCRKMMINADWSGNSWEEKRYWMKNGKKTGLAQLNTIHPLNTDFKRESFGKIEFDNNHVPKYVRETVQTEHRDIPYEDVAHLTLKTIGDEYLGMSVLEPCFKSIHRYMLTAEGIASGVYRHGNPLYDINVGDETHPASKPMLDQAAEEVRNMNFMSEWVHPPWYRMTLTESFSLGNSPNYLKPFIEDIIVASGMPEFVILGKGENTNKAVAQEIIRTVNLTVEPLQQIQKLFIESQILQPMMSLAGCNTVPLVQWNEILPDYPMDPVKKLDILSKIMVGDKPLLTAEELREMARLPTKQKGVVEKLSARKKSLFDKDGVCNVQWS